MISIKHSGSFGKTEKFLKKASAFPIIGIMDKYGREGVAALSSATPMDSGLTAGSWAYEIHRSRSSVSLVFTNSNLRDGIPIAILIQYGHGTSTGGYIQGLDYINPALKPIFTKMSEDIWKEVTNP